MLKAFRRVAVMSITALSAGRSIFVASTFAPGEEAAARDCFQFHHAFVYVHFSEAATVYLNVKLRAADRYHGAGRANLECRRSANTLLDLRAHTANEDLKIFPSTGLGLFQ